MQRQLAGNRLTISAIMVLQIIPLLLFPPESFSPASQEWWLPALLAVLAIVAILSLLVRHSHASWPWNLIAFSQGFNIISRLMLLWPHATVIANKQVVLNTPYVVLTLLAILMSGFVLIFIERPDVRMELAAA